jgi:hypothetical protein
VAGSLGSLAGTIQRKWIEAENGKLQWDKPMQGLSWLYDPESQRMAFQGEVSEQHADLANKWLSHGEWLKLGWGLFFPPKKQEEKGGEEDVLEKFFKDGQRRFERLKSAKGKLSAKTKHSRDWFFENYYIQDGKHSQDITNIKTNYRYLPSNVNDPSKNGQYVNQFDIFAGKIVADQNYGLEGGEMYYDLETDAIAQMSNSEILYQQWKIAKKRVETEEGRSIPVPLRVLRRAHVAGPEGRKVTTAIREKIKDTGDVTFTSKDKEFYLLLGAPNCIAAIWLICDHGEEMGIQGIASITLKKGNSIEVNFING